jgi:hypothetical protein
VSTKPTIKIIKKDERRRAAKLSRAAKNVPPTEQDIDRTMTKTVTGWIREFKEKGDTEAGKLFGIFVKSPRPNEA